ncbi:MAG: transcriptional repressor [Bacillota bacterium]|nr:MAG: transcriptional repressor [Bacillota bacterium]
MAGTGQLRLTAQRRAVLEVVRAARDHPTAAMIYNRVRQRHPGIAYATVYNALNYLVRMGQVRELKFGDGASRYDGRIEPHLHVICIQCGALDEIDLTLPEDVVRTAEQATGYTFETPIVQVFGLCPSCREEARATQEAADRQEAADSPG